jgi:hypothetical protein
MEKLAGEAYQFERLTRQGGVTARRNHTTQPRKATVTQLNSSTSLPHITGQLQQQDKDIHSCSKLTLQLERLTHRGGVAARRNHTTQPHNATQLNSSLHNCSNKTKTSARAANSHRSCAADSNPANRSMKPWKFVAVGLFVTLVVALFVVLKCCCSAPAAAAAAATDDKKEKKE